MALAILILAVIFIAIKLAQPDGLLQAGTGLAGGLAVWCGRELRFVLEGLVMAVLGVALALSGWPLSVGFAILFGLTGLLSLLSGAVVCVRFLRRGGR